MNRRWLVPLLAPIFALTGFGALTLQVVWQRVISLHSGVDLSSATTVVAAFLAGLGIGSLVGGWLADRLGPERSLLAFAAANVGVGVFAWVSIALFYDLYREVAPELPSTAASFAFNSLLVLVPTTLMGLSTPLVARAVTSRVADAGPLVGKLYAINTLGAAAGAAITGWFLLGNLGFVTTVRLAGVVHLVAAGLVLLLHRRLVNEPAPVVAPVPASLSAAVTDEVVDEVDGKARRVWPWLVVYGATGAIALAFEQVFFRLIDAEMRSNSYSFAHVLTLYLLLFGIGSAVGSPLVRRARDPRRWFLWMQFGVGVSALLTLTFFVDGLAKLGYEDALVRYFEGEGYASGFGSVEGVRAWLRVGAVFLGGPLLLMGLPVLGMGLSFPFVQALVSDRLDRIGRRTGSLLAVNTAGNVIGALLAGFVLLDVFGTAGTYRLLAAALGVAGVSAALLAGTRRGRTAQGVGAVVVLGVVLALSPSNQALWAFLHGVPEDRLIVAEDHACSSTIKLTPEGRTLYVNASIQNGHPFDDFHVLIGLLPALQHDDPERALAIGFGMGSTSFGMLADPRLDRVDSVELCGTQYDLAEHLADEGIPDFVRMLDDPRHVTHVGDGRKTLLVDDQKYDLISVDTLRPEAADSGSLYSREFYELVADRLEPGGIVTQWIPKPRVLSSVAQVFPYVVTLRVPGYNQGSAFFLASDEPIVLDRDLLVERLGALPEDAFVSYQRESLAKFLTDAPVGCVVDGESVEDVPSEHENTDLRPRDEYFLNNTTVDFPVPACS